MAPAFHRGDILLLSNRRSFAQVGDIPVVWFAGSPLPMVHRVVEVFYESNHINKSSALLRYLLPGEQLRNMLIR